jgi:predicted transcriptional regulator
MSIPVLPDLEINRILRDRIKTPEVMSQKTFADKAGVHQSTVSRIMRGDFKYGRADIRRRIITPSSTSSGSMSTCHTRPTKAT